MNTIVYFIRHAKPNYSIEDDLTRPLSSKGRKESKELVKTFSEIKIDNIYSSPFKRSIQTIDPIAKSKNMGVKIVNDFREKKICNNWIDDFDEYCKKLWDNFSFKLTDDESLIEVQKRNIKELENTICENKGKAIIIGTHGIALSTIINYYDSTFLYDDFMEIVNIMPYIMKIEFNGNKYIGREEIKL